MLPIPKIVWHEVSASKHPKRVPEADAAMNDIDQVRAYVQAYEWGGATSALQLCHLRELSRMIRTGDTVLDLACGPGPLILELAPLYPDVRFIGADLSPTMLGYLAIEAKARGLDNVTTLEEDIRTLPSIDLGSVNLVISTSALHHLPDEESLRRVFQRISKVLLPSGGFYLFDFGLLRSEKSRQLFVAEVARLAPPITVRDYEASLRACFPLHRVLQLARESLPCPFSTSVSALVDFLYFLQTHSRTSCPENVKAYIDRRWRELSFHMKLEHVMLRALRRHGQVG